MNVIVISEWDVPKDEEKLKKYYGYSDAKGSYHDKKWAEYNAESNLWTNGNGHVVQTLVMEAMDYAKMISDEEYQKEWVRFGRHVKKLKTCVLREIIIAPP